MNKLLLPTETIENRILLIRGKKVMLDRDLAFLYGVETKVLNQAVKRNIGRFPADFMFKLTSSEMEKWRSQFVTSNSEKMGVRRAPFAFSEHGILMLSSVLKSNQAIEVNIQIMRTFIRLRGILKTHKVLWKKIQAMENKYDEQFKVVFDAIRSLLEVPRKPKRQIGFHL